MSIVIPQFVCAYPAAPAAGLTMMGMSEKRVPPSSLGKRSSARYESCRYGLLQADEVGERDESGSPTRSMPNITRVRENSVRKDSPLPCHEDPAKNQQ